MFIKILSTGRVLM